jgi:tetratricopeptide (TPR) repeat protein
MTETSFLDNRQIRIFISSTFKDMQAERGYLVTKVFPVLRRYCEERDVSIFELDLRWGISEEEAKQGKVFEICLNEVRKTRPFFIGLLGERYGWIPTEDERKSIEENTSVFKDYPWIADELDKGASITEIEIQEGVLRAEEKINAYFYFRSPKMEITEEFREKSGSNEEKKLSQLKDTLHKQNAYPIKEYDSIEALGVLVEKDFKKLVDSLFPEGALSPLEKERQQQRNFLKSRTRVYVPNPEWFAKLDAFADSEEKAIVIIGEGGMGKSALIANWTAKRLEQKNKNENIIYHSIGASQSEGNYLKITQRFIDEIRNIYNIPAEEQDKEMPSLEQKNEADKQYEELQNLLFSLPEKEKLIIALDGIEKLLDIENAKLLNWIPPSPNNVKIIFSALPDDTSMEALNLRGYPQLILDALSMENRKHLINDYLKSFGKALMPAQVERIAQDKENKNPLVLLTILDELRVFGVHEKIEGQIDHYLAAPDVESLFDLVLQRIEETFSEGNAQKNLAKDILSLITVSRNGLSETEILELSGDSPLYWSQLFNGLAGHLTTMNGLVSFSNSMIFNAARKRYTPDSAAEESYRSKIARYMETQDQVSFNRKCDELPYQLFELKEWDKLYDFLLDYKAFLYIYGKDRYETGKYWRSLREIDSERYTPDKYLESENIKKAKDDLLSFYLNVFSLVIKILADYPLSLKIAQKQSEIIEKVLGKNHPDNAVSYNNLGGCYLNMGDYERGLEYFNKALTVMEKIHGKNHPDTANSYNNIGGCYSNLGNYQKALGYYNESLTIKKKIFDKNHPDTAASYNSLGKCYINLGNYEKALEYFNEALVIYEKVLGKNHPDTASCYGNIGSCYSFLGDYQKTLDYHNESLAISEKVLGKNHPDTASCYGGIGSCYLGLGNYQKALDYLNESLIIEEKILGKNHPHTAITYNNIGECYSNLGNYEKALEYHNESLAIREKVFGRNHPNTATSYNNLGNCYIKLGNYEKALEYHNASLAIREEVLGKDHPNTTTSYNNLGNCYYYLGNYQKALEYYNEALAIREKVLGKNHPNTATSYNNLGSYYSKLGNYDKALEYYYESLIIREKVLGKNHPDTAASYKNIGNCYSDLGDYQKALDYYNEALTIMEKIFGDNNPNVAIYYNSIGVCYFNLGDFMKAYEYYMRALMMCNSPDGKEAITKNIMLITDQLAKQQGDSNEENS